MTMQQFLNRLQKVAPHYVWRSDASLRADRRCPIEITFNRPANSAFSCKQLTNSQINAIVNAADNGTWQPKKPFKSLRKKLLKAIGAA